MDGKNNTFGDLILYTSIYYYITTIIGIVLLITVPLLIFRNFTKKKKHENEDKPLMSKPLFLANIVTYIILGIILLFIIGFLLRPFIRLAF